MVERINEIEHASNGLSRLYVPDASRVKSIDADQSELFPIEYLDRNSPIGTVISFGGLAEGNVVAPKEFYKTLTNDNRNAVFVKDFHQSWYQHGIVGLGETRGETVANLGEVLSRFSKPWTFIGTSAGGYAAMYFGVALNVAHIIAFCPQTLIDRKTFIRYAKVPPRVRKFSVDDPENDLRNVFSDMQKKESVIDIFYSGQHKMDKFQAERMSDTNLVNLYSIDSKIHNTAKELRKVGLLDEVLSGIYQKKQAGIHV